MFFIYECNITDEELSCDYNGYSALNVLSRVVESESVESHVFSWSRSQFSKLLESESVFKTAGVGVGSRSRFFKTAVVVVCFSKLLESESGVGVGTFVAITDSNVY